MKLRIVLVLLFVLVPNLAWAKILPEMNFIAGYSDREGWVGKKGMSLKNSVGFEYFEKFADDYGDFLTANLQVRLSYDSIADTDDAWALEVHNAWLDYKLGLGKTVRFGHFDPAFGLEPLLDTHATLFQTLAAKNVGFKKDWGVGYRSSFKDYDYQLAAGLGSGMGPRLKDDNYLLTGRIGTQKDDWQYGLSLLYGQVLQPQEFSTIPVSQLKSDNAQKRQRIGLDAQYQYGSWTFLSEAVYGQNDDEDVGGLWFQTAYTIPDIQQLKLEFQTQIWSDDVKSDDYDVTVGFGPAYKISSDWTIRAGYFHDLNRLDGQEDQLAVVQLYYLGP